MLFDLRTYTCRPGTIQLHLALYKAHGYAVQTRHLGMPLLYAVTESGPQNSYVHIWSYQSADDRARRRATLQADPAWIEFLKKSAEAGYLVAQENRLMTPAAFFSVPLPEAMPAT